MEQLARVSSELADSCKTYWLRAVWFTNTVSREGWLVEWDELDWIAHCVRICITLRRLVPHGQHVKQLRSTKRLSRHFLLIKDDAELSLQK